jgi:hypothetical protein
VASTPNVCDLKQRRHGGGEEAEPIVTKFKKRKKTKKKRQALALGHRTSTPSKCACNTTAPFCSAFQIPFSFSQAIFFKNAF